MINSVQLEYLLFSWSHFQGTSFVYYLLTLQTDIYISYFKIKHDLRELSEIIAASLWYLTCMLMANFSASSYKGTVTYKSYWYMEACVCG